MSRPPEMFRVPPAPAPVNRLAYFEERRDAMAETIRQMVEIESPTDNKAAVDRFSRWLAFMEARSWDDLYPVNKSVNHRIW